METHSNDTDELDDEESGVPTDSTPRAKSNSFRVTRVNRNGRLTLFLGALALADGLRARGRNWWRSAVGVLLGTGLLAVGLRQRRAVTDGDDGNGDRETVETSGGATVHTDTMEAGTTDVETEDVTDGETEDVTDASDDG